MTVRFYTFAPVRSKLVSHLAIALVVSVLLSLCWLFGVFPPLFHSLPLFVFFSLFAWCCAIDKAKIIGSRNIKSRRMYYTFDSVDFYLG